MAGRSGASSPPDAKTVAAQAKSPAKKVAKSVARGRVSATNGRTRAAKRWKPTAGEHLRADLWRDTDPGGIKLLVEQVCRVADRLETLDRINRGDADALATLDLGRILAQETPSGDRKAFYVEVSLTLRDTVGEERQQAKLFASLLSDIARQRAALPPPPPGEGSDDDDDDLNIS